MRNDYPSAPDEISYDIRLLELLVTTTAVIESNRRRAPAAGDKTPMVFLSPINYHWHYKTWQRLTAGYLRTFVKNRLPNNELIGYVINDKHPKSIRVACDRYIYVVRYKKTFRMTKKVWAHDEHKEAKLGDIVRVQPMGYRIGPWKTYVLARVLHSQDPHLKQAMDEHNFS